MEASKAITAILLLIFFGILIVAMSIPRIRSYSYHTDLKNLTYQVSRVADNLASIQREIRKTREAFEKQAEGNTENE